MSPATKCQRCSLPIVGTSYHLQLEANPPKPSSLEVYLCENCVESMSRWLTRRSRKSDAFQVGATAPVEAPSAPVAASGRRRRRSDVIAQYESESNRKLFVSLFFASILVIVMVSMVALAVVGNQPQTSHRTLEFSAPEQEP